MGERASEKSKMKTEFRKLTTFGIGGKIDNYFEVKNEKEIRGAVEKAKKNNLKIFIIGGGSDILASDKKFGGVVIKYIGDSIKFSEDGTIESEAGLSWDRLVEAAVERNLGGVECLSGIPGTVGASPIQNIGAYGQELKDVFAGLEAFDIRKEKFVKFDKEACEFSYRESIFKKKEYWQRYLITKVILKLVKDAKPKIRYDSLSNYLAARNIKNPSLYEVRLAVLEIRASKFESPDVVGNAGSFFKNPVIDRKKADGLLKKYPGMPCRRQNDGTYKCFAGWFIEKAGWKGKTHKGAGVSPNHALILINKTGNAKASDVAELSNLIIKDVKEKFGIVLSPEVQFINFDGEGVKKDSKVSAKTAILGFGIEGQDLKKYLEKKGKTVDILDQKLDKDYLSNLSKYDLIYRSPGVYRFLPEIVEAEKKGAEISSAINVFFEKCPGKVIGVTGTKGKGTTSTLIYSILINAGKDVYLAGNIGTSYLSILPKLNKDSIVIMELSSFQLIDLKRSPDIAVILNITSDHMDWHKSQEEYLEAKKNIVKNQGKDDYAVINEEYESSKSFAKETKAKVVFFSKGNLEKEFREDLKLRGAHNLENIAASVAAARVLDIDDDIIEKTVKEFKGLEHRLELIGEAGGVKFYNDSFATGPQPTIAAINSFDEDITLILGGSDKGLDYSELQKEIQSKKNVKNLILIGDIGEKIGGSIKGKNIIKLGKTSMKTIVKKAYKATKKGGVVIFSPAAASFDMFENYKDRGNQFKENVRKLLI